jgi:hypothetical protein
LEAAKASARFNDAAVACACCFRSPTSILSSRVSLSNLSHCSSQGLLVTVKPHDDEETTAHLVGQQLFFCEKLAFFLMYSGLLQLFFLQQE